VGARVKWRFAAKFLVAFALLLVAWSTTGFAHGYRSAVLATVQMASPLVNGWWLDYDRPGSADDAVFRAGDREIAMLIQLPALSIGLVFLVSLLLATPGLGRRQRIGRAATGAILYFLLDTIVVLAYPLLLDRPNAVKNTLGVFLGLTAFVVAPLGLWFVLTYPALRGVWGLTRRG